MPHARQADLIDNRSADKVGPRPFKTVAISRGEISRFMHKRHKAAM